MTSTKGVERLISQRWPKLKKKANDETDPERVIAVLEEIDDFLSNLEMRIAAQTAHARTNLGSISTAIFPFVPPGDSESEFDE
jgi:hypothetical protein